VSVADSDTAAVRRAARRTALQITVAASALVILILLGSLLYVIYQSTPAELLEKPAPGESKIYIDVNDVLAALVVVGIVSIVLVGGLSWLVARRAVRPLGRALRMQREFVADASHELRTPLSVLDLRIQRLQRSPAVPQAITEELAALRRDSQSLIDVVGDLLLAAAGEQHGSVEPPSDVTAIVSQAVDALRLVADRRDVRLRLSTGGDVFARVPATSIRRCVVALLDNAIAHSPDGAEVDVALLIGKHDFELIVTDHGTGIQGIEPGRIFDRFAHTEPATGAGRRTGFGIGLALVRDVAVRHGGRVEVRQTSRAGTTIVLTLPRAGERR
jgi:signal transduction histidine kinase